MSASEPDSPILKTPEWLEILENKRKRPHKLAHEIGAGAPCLVCKEGCKGLNLHFWRKLCIECKCRKEDHEVQEEEDYAQFEILFGAKKVKRTTLKFNAQNKSFDWIPPNVSADLAVDYLKSIPQSKLPISNSEGARYRKQQIEKQLPLHDVDPSACHNLSDKEMQEFLKYLDNLKNNVIGQGKIMKYQSPKILMEDNLQNSSSNMTTTGEKYFKSNSKGAEPIEHLEIRQYQKGGTAISQSLQTDSYPTDNLLNVQLYKYSQPVSSSKMDHQPLRTSSLRKNDNFNIKYQHSIMKASDKNFPSPKPFFPVKTFTKDESKGGFESVNNNQQNTLSLKTPSSFTKKKLPVSDKHNNNNLEAINRDDNCNEEFLFSGESYSQHPGKMSEESGMDSPLNPCTSLVSKVPLAEFERLNVSISEVPFALVQETGALQNPDKGGSQIKELPHKSARPSEELSEEFPTPPSFCQQCLEILYPEEVVVQTERGGNFALWHAKCFVCETCKELLVDLMYFFNKGKVYCGRHYAEIMNIPRCNACDELIFVKEYTCAEGDSYHVRHFCCFHCDQPLGGKQYIPKDNQPVCLDCFQIKYGKTCRTCQKRIAAGEQRVSWKELDFHVYPECFRCSKCLKSLIGGKFVVKNLNTFCSKECVQEYVN